MNIIGCLDKPSTGSYHLAGREVAAMSDDELAATRNREIGFVFQNFNLLPRMSALQNVALPLVYAGADARTRVARGRTDAGGRRPPRAAPSPAQRAVWAASASGWRLHRALVVDPGIIIADEPTGNLDTKSSLEIMDIFCRLNAQGRMVIMVTHEPDIAAYARRVIQIRDGLVIKDETKPGVA